MQAPRMFTNVYIIVKAVCYVNKPMNAVKFQELNVVFQAVHLPPIHLQRSELK